MNFFKLNSPVQPGCEHFETLCKNGGITVERIASNRLENGEWYDQEHDEWVMLVQGSAVIEYEGGETTALTAGDHLFIPSRQRHRVLETSADALWLAVHFAEPTPSMPLS